MNWNCLRPLPWLDTRARFVAQSPRSGTLLDLGSSDGETLGHIAEGAISVAPLLTGRVGLGGVARAFEDLAAPDRHAKILVEPGRN